jgi:hypothetical protein
MTTRSSCMNFAVSADFRLALASVACGLALGCAGHDDLTGSASEGGGEAEPAASETEAYSDAECQAATADAFGTFTQSAGYLNESPVTYSNSKAFKSYVWDVTLKSTLSEVYTDLNLVSSHVSPMVYDTQTECEALSFNRRLYKRAAGGTGFSMYAEAFAHGKWDADFGCIMPSYYGPDIRCGNTLPCNVASSGTTIRVCVSARDSNGNTMPVVAYVRGTAGIRTEPFANPQVRVGTTWLPVQNDTTSALAYCIKRNDVSAAFTTPSSTPVWPFAFFSSATHTWRIPTGSTPGTVIGSVECAPLIRSN